MTQGAHGLYGGEPVGVEFAHHGHAPEAVLLAQLPHLLQGGIHLPLLSSGGTGAGTTKPVPDVNTSKDGLESSRCHLGSRADARALCEMQTHPRHVTCALRRGLLGARYRLRSVRPRRPIQRSAFRPGSHRPGLAPRACGVYLPPHRFMQGNIARKHIAYKSSNIPVTITWPLPAPKETSNPFGAMDKHCAQTVLVPAELRAALVHAALRI